MTLQEFKKTAKIAQYRRLCIAPLMQTHLGREMRRLLMMGKFNLVRGAWKEAHG